MAEGLNAERKSLGLAVRNVNDPMANVTGDEQNFKFALITPREPRGIAGYEQTYETIDENGVKQVITNTIKRNVPQLVSTMALGNLNAKEVALSRIYTEMSRKCAWHGYLNLAIEYYLKVVHLNVTSQSHQSQLLRQILTETVSVSRKEETAGYTKDLTGEKENKIAAFMDKLKSKDAQGQSGLQTTGTQSFGLK